MGLMVHQDAARFYAEASPMLLANEAHHNLMLGIALNLINQSAAKCHLLTCQSPAGTGAALLSPGYPLALANWPQTDMADLVQHFISQGIFIRSVLGTPKEAAYFAESYHLFHQKLFAKKNRNMYVYQLRGPSKPCFVPNLPRLADTHDATPLYHLAEGFYDVTRNPSFNPASIIDAAIEEKRLYVLDQIRVVAMAAFVRDTPHAKAISLVYTDPAFRKQGYAKALVSHLCNITVRENKQMSVLFADVADPAANRLYQSIGFNAVSKLTEIQFELLPI